MGVRTPKRRPKPEPALRLDGSTMVMACEAFRPGAVARIIEKGEWMPLDSSVVATYPERFAVRLSDLERERAARQEGEPG